MNINIPDNSTIKRKETTMPVALKHIDKIAREENRDVIFINFSKEVFPSYEYREYKERNALLQWWS